MIKNFLFVCTGNICRSPMAAAVCASKFEKHKNNIDVSSAGIAALVGKPCPSPVLELMVEKGLDVSSHRGLQVDIEMATRFDLILVMEKGQQRFIEQKWVSLKGRVRQLGAWRDEEILDPYGLPVEYYAHCLRRIELCVGDWGERLFL